MAPAYGYEVKEDEEQNKKLKEIVELLVASGYFRARIKGFSAFDKVVGGIVWCISVCSYDIDVDLLFQENATIGQKIFMTEKIVKVLQEMNCPHQVEPHQIQGLDCIHIFPVVQWLVKKAIESKKGKEDYNRSFAISEFNKIHSLADDKLANKKVEAGKKIMDGLKFQPERKYRRVDVIALQDENLQVESTLLEYGRKQHFIDSSGSSDKPGEHKDGKQAEEEHVEALLSGMSQASTKEGVIPSDLVDFLVNQHSEEINKIMSDYDVKAKLLKETSSLTQASSKKSVSVFNKQIEILENNLKSLENERRILKEKVEESQESLKKLLEEGAALSAPLEEFDDSQKKSLLHELEKLVALSDDLKKQEVDFKASCMSEKKILEEQIQHLNLRNENKENDEDRRKIKEDLEENSEKLRKLRLVVGRKNREMSALQRKLDDVPSRDELRQYQCRFMELHNQVISKHKETKQYFTLYNTLDDTRLYLSKEVDLLNSILDNFEKALLSESQRSAFMKQFEQMVEVVKQNKLKVERRKQEVKAYKGQLQDKLMEVIEKQRLYFKAVKDFQEECRKNEIILARLQQLE